jgi:hypothetical protein
MALRNHGIVCENRDTLAKYPVRDPNEVLVFLNRLLRLIAGSCGRSQGMDETPQHLISEKTFEGGPTNGGIPK